MKILFTGGGTGGHFYPIIAVAEAIRELAKEKHLIEPRLYYAAPDPYDREALRALDIQFVRIRAGKVRRYFSLRNILDAFVTVWGVFISMIRIFFIFPDVVFGKGGHGSFPTLLAARLFGIPVIIHESDAHPGRVNTWAGKFAQHIALSFSEASSFFPKEKIAMTGNPVRKVLMTPSREGAHEFLKLEASVPVILVLGGSQGAQALNEAIVESLPLLLPKYQVIHQTGDKNFAEVTATARITNEKSEYAHRYHPYAYLNELALRMSAGVATLIISRAGSSIFEFALWGIPSILVPLPKEVAAEDHQSKNAFAYARGGGAIVIEQNNLTPTILASEIERIIGNNALYASMQKGAREFAKPEAARTIAEGLLGIALSHED